MEQGYKATGDVTNDGINQYLYDAEGRICAVYASNPVLGASSMTGYLYDADGTRVAKGSISAWSCDPTANGFTTTNDYILGLGGEQLTEMGMGGTTSSGGTTTGLVWQHANIWAGGKLLGTYDKDGLHFYLDDPLGTRRAQTDASGVLEQTCSSLPFGDGLACSEGDLLAPTENHFTGKERDAESGNDYFGARYYSSNMGRFMSPDWSAKEEPVPYAKLDDPQTLNLYAYVGNNPLARVDADGHETKHHHNKQSPPAPHQTQEQKAEVGYGETSGLIPARNPNAPAPAKGKKENPYDPLTWDKTSAEQLQKARENIIDISEKNRNVHKAKAGSNPIEQEIWKLNEDAAKHADGSLSGKYFFIRQEGVGKQHPSPKAGYGQGDPTLSYGPFRNVGGGDVPRGDKTYVDIYDK